MQIFPWAHSILLPLAPTIGGEIAIYLQWVVREFYTNLADDGDRLTAQLLNQLSGSGRMELALRRVPTLPYQYVSAIAYRLAAKLSLTPVEICQLLQPQVDTPALNPQECLEIRCWYNNAGYLYFQLTPRSIATWLTWLNYLHDLPSRACLEIDRSPVSIDIALYAHARCCSLLSLASSEKLVSINDRWQITPCQTSTFNRVRGLNGLIAEPLLIFESPVEERLIHVLMDVLDTIWMTIGDERLQLSQLHRLTIDLARSWLEFYRYCRVFDSHRHNPHLAIARCGLTAISRRYLQVLLEDYLGLMAPTEL
jgi:DALR anticodon binding domain